MTAGRKRQYILGAALLLAVAALILAVFSLLSRTDKGDIYLNQDYGWSYELLVDDRVQSYEPVQGEDGYTLDFPEGTKAVRITRTMTEDIPRAELEWMTYLSGVEVFLDGDLIHSSFWQTRRGDDGFLRPTEEDWDRIEREQGNVWQHVRVSLPVDYLGKELSMVTYFKGGEVGETQPEFPYLGREGSYMAQILVISVRYNVIMTVYALLALLVAGMFLLDIHNGNADGRTMLLCLYFLLLFVRGAYNSEAGYYSVLSSYLAPGFLEEIYIVPLYLYLALQVKSRWKWPLCGGIMVWAVYECVRKYLFLRQNLPGTAETTGPGALIVLLVVATVYCAENLRRGRKSRAERMALLNQGIVAAAVTVAYLVSKFRAWGSPRAYLVNGVWTALSMGSFWPVVTLITDIVSYTMLILVVTEVVRRTIQTRRTVDVLRERSRLTMEGYERTLHAEEAINAANHEMRHHMTALAGILQDGDVARAREYVASVTSTLDKLPTVRYSQNILVNTIAGVYLDQARAQGIRVECSLAVPVKLDIPDEDLSVFLTNLLENALHACQRIDPGQPRYICLKMALRENFLFIGCVNSAPGEQEEAEVSMEERAFRRHGYGREAMRRIAEKYGSMLLLEHADGEYSVKSNFNLRAPKTARSAGPRD